MAFGDKISQGKNLLATGGGAVNEPQYAFEVFYMLSDDKDYTFLCSSTQPDLGEIVNALLLLFGDNLAAISIDPFKKEET